MQQEKMSNLKTKSRPRTSENPIPLQSKNKKEYVGSSGWWMLSIACRVRSGRLGARVSVTVSIFRDSEIIIVKVIECIR